MRHRNHSEILLAAFILLASLLPAPALAQDAEHATGKGAGNGSGYSYARIVRLSLVNGDVQYMRPGESKWQPAIANMPMQQGFTIGTNLGRAEVELENGSRIWLAENSMLQFTELALAKGGHINTVSLAYGTATFSPDLKLADIFQVIAPRFQVTVPGKTAAFRVDVSRDTNAVRVIKGNLAVQQSSGTENVASGKETVVRGQTFSVSGKAPGLIAASDRATKDGWDTWVENRDNLVTNGTQQTLQYMNAGFNYGLGDMASYGAWNYYPGYGYGWQPYGIGAGWQPFSSGEWGFYPGVGWTWLSEEPWGWAPYHFGQWTNQPGFGWFWRPTESAFFNPAPVKWMQAGNKIGWIPLGASTKTTPVVVSERGLGKWGPTQILAAEKAGSKLQEMSSAPMANGRAGVANAVAAKSAESVRPAMPRSAPPANVERQPMPNEPAYRGSASTPASVSAANRSGFPTAASRAGGAGAPSMTSAHGSGFSSGAARGSAGASHASSGSSSSSSSGGHPK